MQKVGLQPNEVPVVVDGKVKIIDTAKNVTAPELTGHPTLDKELQSGYRADLQQQIKDVTTLFKAQKISKDEAISKIDQLKAAAQKSSGPRKARVKSVHFKLPLPMRTRTFTHRSAPVNLVKPLDLRPNVKRLTFKNYLRKH